MTMSFILNSFSQLYLENFTTHNFHSVFLSFIFLYGKLKSLIVKSNGSLLDMPWKANENK